MVEKEANAKLIPTACKIVGTFFSSDCLSDILSPFNKYTFLQYKDLQP